MQIGMIGAGRMGSNMVLRLLAGGHECIVYDPTPGATDAVAAQGATASPTMQEFIAKLAAPRVIWLMVPAASVDAAIAGFVDMLDAGDIVIDGGNSHFADDIRRARTLEARRIRYVDVGTSGGIAGRRRGYCLMVGGDAEVIQHLDPIFDTLAPGVDAAPRTAGRDAAPTQAEKGYLHCGPAGAGHFVKMVHNGIEYGLMAAYAEGLNILAGADIGTRAPTADAETSPLADRERYQYDFDVAQICELWRRGSVIGSWLLDLTAQALLRDPSLESYSGRVSDSGEGRWALAAAIDEGVPTPVLASALFDRFNSRGHADFANRVLSAMRREFGGHGEPPAPRAR